MRESPELDVEARSAGWFGGNVGRAVVQLRDGRDHCQTESRSTALVARARWIGPIERLAQVRQVLGGDRRSAGHDGEPHATPADVLDTDADAATARRMRHG